MNTSKGDVEIITIGDEILIGQIVDTNSAFMGQQLALNGLNVVRITSIPDKREHILNALKDASSRADIILITGGLGPTKDDVTKKTLCEYFNTTLYFDELVFEDVKTIFSQFGKEVSAINRLQAEVPENCTVIRNKNGTAPAMWFEENEKVFVSMPGVPYEMKSLMVEKIIPKLKSTFKFPFIYHKTILTQGIGESDLSEIIANWEDSLSELNIKLAYLPSPGKVKLRLSITGENESKIIKDVDDKITELYKYINQYIYGIEIFGEDPISIEEIVGKKLLNSKKTISTAESCTGGYISHLLTRIPGSSAYYMGSVISYSYEIKETELKVPKHILEKEGAVSKPVVEQMAKAIREKYKTDYSIAASGIAGPSGATPDKPVGTVWVAIATPERIFSKVFLFGNNRERNIKKTAFAALNMLREELE